MNRFVKHLLLFSLMVSAFFIAGEIYVENTSYKHDEIAWRGKLLEEMKDSIQTLFIGSSLLHAAVSDTIWGPQAFNLAIIAASPEYEYFIADTVIPRLPNLKEVVIELGYQTLRDDRDYIEDFVGFIGWCRPTIYLNTRKYSRWSTHGFELFEPRTFREKLFNLYRFFGKEDVDNQLEAPKKLLEATYRRDQGEKLASSYTGANTYFNDNLRFLEGIIKKAKEQGAEVVLCTPPVLAEYRQYMDPDQLSELYSTAGMLCRKYNIRYFNYLADTRFGLSDFLDISHLNHGRGRRKFTRIFRQDMLTDSPQNQPVLHNDNE